MAGDEEEAASGLAHRIEEAAALLRGLGVRLVRLEGSEATEVLTAASDPEAESLPRASSGRSVWRDVDERVQAASVLASLHRPV